MKAVHEHAVHATDTRSHAPPNDSGSEPAGRAVFLDSPVQTTQVLLARCIRTAHQATRAAPPAPTDWDQLVRAACDGWLGGLLLDAVERNGWSLPPYLLAPLRRQATRIHHNNARIMGRLSAVAAALERNGVAVLLLKGAGLNLTVYDNFGLRAMSDLDLLVRINAAPRAMAVLEALGFRRGPALLREDFFPRFHYEVEYVSGGPRAVRIDLHVRPFRPLRFAQTVSNDVFWRSSREIEVDAATVYVPGDSEQFVHLATHSACHGHSRLVWLYDICRLVDLCGPRLNWDQILRTSRDCGLTAAVRDAVDNVEKKFGPVIPDAARAQLNRAKSSWRDRLCIVQARHDVRHPLRHVVVNLFCMVGLRTRLSYLLAVIFPGAGHIGQIYSRRHPGWLMVGHAKRWIRAAVGPVHNALL